MNNLILLFYKIMSLILALGMSFNMGCGENQVIDTENGTVSVICENGWASRLFPMSDGNLLAGYKKGTAIYTAISSDGGETFTNHTLAIDIEGLDCDNVNFFELDGKIYLSHRAIGFREDGSFYGSIRVMQSDDFGKSWQFHSIIAENTEIDGQFKGVWEPCLGEIDGNLVCVYANDSTSVTEQQNIESLTYIGSRWTNRTILSDGEKHDSRDGMPVWCRLLDGSYALVIESTKYRDEGYPFVIQILTSKDGYNWSEPMDVYIPSTEGSKAAAPGICQTDDGTVYITFQTDEDKDVKGDGTSVAKIICIDKITKLTRPYNYSKPEKIFPAEHDGRSVWGGIYTDGNKLYYSAGTPLGAVCNIFNSRQ